MASVILDSSVKNEKQMGEQGQDDDDDEYTVGKPSSILKEEEQNVRNYYCYNF